MRGAWSAWCTTCSNSRGATAFNRRPSGVRPYLLTFIEEVARNDSIPNESFSVETAEDVTLEFDRAHLKPGAVEPLATTPWRHCRRVAGSVRITVSRGQIE